MNRQQIENVLYRKMQTVKFAAKPVKFLQSMAKPVNRWNGGEGQVTPVDGDALALLRLMS